MINNLEIKPIETKDKIIKFDFFIDGIELDKILGINRLTDMRFCDFDLDICEIDKQKFTNYNRLKYARQKINAFVGVDKPCNQFQTDRIVLYRCHCGCDYCGVISFEINFENDYVYWRDIRFELDNETETHGVKSIKILQFDSKKYIGEFNKFVEKHYNIIQL